MAFIKKGGRSEISAHINDVSGTTSYTVNAGQQKSKASGSEQEGTSNAAFEEPHDDLLDLQQNNITISELKSPMKADQLNIDESTMMQIDNVGFKDALLLPESSFKGIDYNCVDGDAKRESIKGCRESSNCFYQKGANADKPFF